MPVPAAAFPDSEVPRVLVADDQRTVLEALRLLLKGEGFHTEAVTGPASVLTALQSQDFDVVLMDLNYTKDTTSGGEGLDLLTSIRTMNKDVPLVVMTAWGNMELAIEAMRRGASDFILKPWENRQLTAILRGQVQRRQALRRAARLQEQEFAEAREIQSRLLPASLPHVPGYELAAESRAARFVGGDYYDVVKLRDDRTALCIADVAGKGMPGALLMSSLQAALRPMVVDGLSPADVCRQLNQTICDLAPVGKFISFFYCLLEENHKCLTYANAGHNAPLLVKADGHSSALSGNGAVLGQFRDWKYEQEEIGLDSGDRLVMFTDGLVEAESQQGEEFGEIRLAQLAANQVSLLAASLREKLFAAAACHCNSEFHDDTTLLVLAVK